MWDTIASYVLLGFAWLVAVLIVLVVLDSTLGRWLLKRMAVTFEAHSKEGGSPGSGRFLVHFPGILFDGVEGVNEILDALLKHVSEGLFIRCGFHRFLSREVIEKTAAEIGPPTADRRLLDIVGTSVGGKMGLDLIKILETNYGWKRDVITVNHRPVADALDIQVSDVTRIGLIETPLSVKMFMEPGDKLAILLSKLYPGPLVSWVAQFIIPGTFILPFDYNIEDDERDKDEVRKIALKRMSAFKFSMICDLQRYLVNENVDFLKGAIGVHVTYMVCIRNNVTVSQPFALDEVWRTISEHTKSFDVIEVDSPHCGYLERKRTWSETFDAYLAVSPEDIVI